MNRIFLFGNFQSFVARFGFALLASFGGFPSLLAVWAFSWLASSVTAFQLSPSCLWCPLEFLVAAFGPYLFGPDLLAFVALKVLSNNHLHLLVIRFAFVV